jgi:hypothetical protein
MPKEKAVKAIPLGSFSTNSRERVVARLMEHGTRRALDLRVFDHTGGVEFPSKNAVSLRLEHLRPLRDLVTIAMRESIERGLLDVEDVGNPGSETEGAPA